MWVSFKRVLKTGYKIFFRNIALNTATVFVMTMVVLLITFIFLFNISSNILISSIEEKVDISVYLREDVLDEDALELKSVLVKIPEVKEVEYISREEALEKFIERHKDDPILMESLTEVGKNPFLDSLSISAWQASQYGQVTTFLEGDSFRGLIEKIDYYKRKPVIERIFSITSGINRGAILFGIALALVSFLIAFNTIKIAINNASEEVSIMRLVGASNWFIRGPFLVQGIISGTIAVLITLLLTFIITLGLNGKVQVLAPEISLFGLFLSNIFVILLIQIAVGIGLGVISSLSAVRKCLKV